MQLFGLISLLLVSVQATPTPTVVGDLAKEAIPALVSLVDKAIANAVEDLKNRISTDFNRFLEKGLNRTTVSDTCKLEFKEFIHTKVIQRLDEKITNAASNRILPAIASFFKALTEHIEILDQLLVKKLDSISTDGLFPRFVPPPWLKSNDLTDMPWHD
jgi:hypothetical protein